MNIRSRHARFAFLTMVIVVAGLLAAPATAGETAIEYTATHDAQVLTCNDTYVATGSGLIHVFRPAQEDCLDAAYHIVFRPLTGKPNAACTGPALLQSVSNWGLNDSGSDGYYTYSENFADLFTGRYNVCFYPYPNTMVASGTIASNSVTGTTVNLPYAGADYRVVVTGTYANGSNNVADAEFVSLDGWTTWVDGYNVYPYSLGAGFGDVQVNGAFVDWGGYSATHEYSYNLVGAGSSLTLRVFDGDSATGIAEASWYGDNTGTLAFAIYYVGPH